MEKEIVIGKYTLESLTNGMYSDPLDLYREYIQNAVDSIDAAKEEIRFEEKYLIEIGIDELAGTISIIDNGKGISKTCAVKTLIDIGNSEKNKRKTRGFRGIGRLAGLGYSDVLYFSTSCAGEPIKTVVRFDTQLLRKLLFCEDENLVSINDVMKKIITTYYEEEMEEAHYFQVMLEGIPTKEELLDIDVVENYILQHAPLPFTQDFLWASTIKEKCKIFGYNIPEYSIKLNGKLLFKPYQNRFLCDRVKRREDSIYDIEVKPFYRDGKLTAIMWHGVIGFYGTILENQIKGIRIRQGNIMIGDKATCNRLFREERFNGWLVGELYVIDPDLIVNARRDYFEQNESHYDLSESFMEWSAEKIKEIRKISCSRSLSDKKLKVVEAIDIDDVNDLFTENEEAYSESEFIDREENEEVSEIDFMNKLSWLINQKQNKTKYTALNINESLTGEQRKTLEKVFDIIVCQYRKKEAEKIIDTIAINF